MIRVGTGSAMSGDRTDAAVELLDEGVDYLVLEQLAERTIAMAYRRKRSGGVGYSPMWDAQLRPILRRAANQGTTIITNGGAADPVGAAEHAADIAADEGIPIEITVMTGDACTEHVLGHAVEYELADAEVVSANAYLGAEELLAALRRGPPDGDLHLVVTGRVADPSMYVAPLCYEYGWSLDDWDRLGQATVIGHLLECGAILTGGYFMEPGRKSVPDPHRLGYPYAEVSASGDAIIAKPEGSGGRLDRQTAREQLFHEIHDPKAYLTPDVTADFTGVTLEPSGEERLSVTGGTGTPRPKDLKASVGVREGYRAEFYMAYGGQNAAERARLGGQIVRDRITKVHERDDVDFRIDVVGVDALYGSELPASVQPDEALQEVMLRVAARADSRETAELVWREGYTLFPIGPAAGGGFHPQSPDEGVSEVIGIASVLVPREVVTSDVAYASIPQREVDV